MLRPLLAAMMVAAFALLVAASGSPVVPTLTATVTGKSITLTGSDGKRIRTLQPNQYKIVVHDRTKGQNFHLVGPNVNMKTRIAKTSTTTWTVYLRLGSYKYRSDANMRLSGAFVVAGSPPA